MRIKAYLTLAVAGVMSISTAVATVLERLQTSDLARRASVAVMGEVVDSRSTLIDGSFATIATIKVEAALWGTDAAMLEVQVPGGQQKVGKFYLGTSVPSAPLLLIGTKFILMLTRPSSSDNLTVVGMSQGALPVLRTAEGNVVMLPGAGTPLPVADAMREINQARTSEKSNNVLR